MQILQEETSQELISMWRVKAKELKTTEELKTFMDSLINDYGHDYGTICHAITAAAIGAAMVIDNSPQGGITGFQAGCIMWSFIELWIHEPGPKKLVKYSDMLYPQYEHKFEKTIDKRTWEWLQKEAQRNVDKERAEAVDNQQEYPISPNVLAHWKSVARGEMPFGYTLEVEEATDAKDT